MPKRHPVVFYRPSPTGRIVVGHPAIVCPINHSSNLVSNTKEVITSPVEVIFNDGEFHTRNSIYRLSKD